MPAVTKIIDPVTRLEGHLKIEVTIDTVNQVQQVTDAKATGTLFRGFEILLQNRPAEDAPHITQRICGVCPVSHGMAAVLAQDAVAKVTVPDNARIMRNLVLGANYIQSHILHFYHLAVQDFVDGPGMAPWQPSWSSDKRLDASTTSLLVSNYVTALSMRRQAHELGAVFGGRLPHPPTYISGGFTTVPRAGRITQAKNYLNTLIPFIQNTYIPNVQTLANGYPDYLSIGRGYGNLLAYGVFDEDNTGTNKLLGQGRVANGATTVNKVNVGYIAEQVAYSWYAGGTLKPAAGATTPQYPKTNAYSWLKAPRYSKKPYEVGPLARMWVNGDYRQGISVMDRHMARAQETLKVALAMREWLGQLNSSGAVYAKPGSQTGSAFGLTEAPRGALGHWISLNGGKISKYQVVTPTCWNASPRDAAGKRGPIEQALIGTPVLNIDEPVEVVRVIHSFDPCLSCAVHVMRPGKKAKVVKLGHSHGEEEIQAHDHGDGRVHTHVRGGGHTHGD